MTTWYLYDGGNLVAEYDNTGTRLKRYDYLPFGYAPAQINENASTYEVQVDHLDTPRLLVDQNQNVVWRSNHQAFGDTQPDEDVDGDGVSITFNMRFPGQYYDDESGLYYNWNRYYDPKIGRYVTSDPIGLNGGLNTYGYVQSAPINYYDPAGLEIVGHWDPPPHLTNFGFDIGFPSLGINSVTVTGRGNASVKFGVSCKDTCSGDEWKRGFELGFSASATDSFRLDGAWCAGAVRAGQKRLPSQLRWMFSPLLAPCYLKLALAANNAVASVKSELLGELFYEGSLIANKLLRDGPTKLCGG